MQTQRQVVENKQRSREGGKLNPLFPKDISLKVDGDASSVARPRRLERRITRHHVFKDRLTRRQKSLSEGPVDGGGCRHSRSIDTDKTDLPTLVCPGNHLRQPASVVRLIDTGNLPGSQPSSRNLFEISFRAYLRWEILPLMRLGSSRTLDWRRPESNR